MKFRSKPRLPGVVQKLLRHGGGAHAKKKGNGSYTRKQKHRLRDTNPGD